MALKLTSDRCRAQALRAHTMRSPRCSLANAIVHSGWRYAVCGGAECEALHDDIDSACIRPIAELRPNATDRELVMTTWHEDESVDDVAFFFVRSTVGEGGEEFSEFVVLHLGGTPEERAALEQAVREQEFLDPAV